MRLAVAEAGTLPADWCRRELRRFIKGAGQGKGAKQGKDAGHA